jgi:hypothetical protein
MDVEKIYPPGAEVVIFSDGRVFSGKMELYCSLPVQEMRFRVKFVCAFRE